MGNCNPGRVITYEKFITDGILTQLLNAGIDIKNVVFFSNDEIVIDTTDIDRSATFNIVYEVCSKAVVPLRIEEFHLDYVTKNDKIIGYIKVLDDGTYDFKCFNGQDLLLVLRTLNGEDIRESDLVFENESFLARYIEVPVIKILKEAK